MPLYETRCKACNDKDTLWRRIAERDNLPACRFCQGEVERIISAPRVVPEIAPFISPGTDRYIDSRAKWRDDLKRSGAIPWEPGIDKDIARNREREYERAFAPVAAAVDSAVSAAVAAGNLEA